jgi:hypothetical protein
MAYTPANLSCVVSSLGGIGPSVFTHYSADATTAADASGFISNGGNYGMKRNDIVFHTDITTPTAPVTTSHVVVSVNATTGAVDLSNGTVIGSGTNSD